MKRYELTWGAGLLLVILGIAGTFGSRFDPTPTMPFPLGPIILTLGALLLLKASKMPKDKAKLFVYWSENGRKGEQDGCWHAKYGPDTRIRGTGDSQDSAIRDFLITAATFQLPDKKDAYEIVEGRPQ